ncbi:unnamed protein product [Ceutorhynchus assimilis]|uniref:Mitotic spindle assembly checkpoint protein MAD2A n=1 Tax=Ceutorhynchus assimilis TaxID=467358 RepID=A0A9N9QFN1_9CUCU|nr:unnamed protein product [Ceutorhynchus assimilis]
MSALTYHVLNVICQAHKLKFECLSNKTITIFIFNFNFNGFFIVCEQKKTENLLYLFIDNFYNNRRNMTTAAVKSKSAITVKGSAEIVCEYLNFGINSILFQRGIYPPENFQNAENYGLNILMSTDNKIKEFLATTLEQLKEWLLKRTVHKVALVITNVKSMEVMERWDFKIEYEGDPSEGDAQTSEKPLKQIKNEIRDVLKQIASSVAYLPLLDCLCSFDLQIYTKNGVDLPNEWSEAEPANIKNAQSVKMRSFSTNIHKMETAVTYRNDD